MHDDYFAKVGAVGQHNIVQGNQDCLVIVPAAGFGRRAGLAESTDAGTGAAKELLPRPTGTYLAGEPMINLALQCAQQLSAYVHVVTRAEKTQLIDYLSSCNARADEARQINLQIVRPTREWPDTILQARAHWRDINLVVLPDTDFAPLAVLEKMQDALQVSPAVFATFSADDYQTWGVVDSKNLRHCEKPQSWPLGACAWGVFGFRRAAGEALLQSLLQSTLDHQWRPLPHGTQFLQLESFKDLTRTV
jgi:hypothetical protein